MGKIVFESLAITILIFCLVASSSAKTQEPEEEISEKVVGKNGKVLSLFSIVTFKNTPCHASSGLNGTCYTSSECTNKGGTSTGNCASGFGVCCVFTISAAGSINYNGTYIQNPSYPSVYSSTSALTYTVNKCSTDICWLRLDFQSFTLLGPSISTETLGGACQDTFKITSTSTSTVIPTICGQNTGQHLYIDVGAASATATLAFTFGTAATTTRTWNILVNQISCSSRSSPPSGCLQYFFSPTGRIQTFNFLDTTTSHLASQRYSVCIRPEQGMCCIDYGICTDQSSAYTLSAGAILATTAIAAPVLLDSLCTLDWTEIVGSTACSSQGGDLHSRYCGGVFGIDTTIVAPNLDIHICDCTLPFRMSFVADAMTDIVAAMTLVNSANLGISRGNCFDYRQIPCGTSGPAS